MDTWKILCCLLLVLVKARCEEQPASSLKKGSFEEYVDHIASTVNKNDYVLVRKRGSINVPKDMHARQYFSFYLKIENVIDKYAFKGLEDTSFETHIANRKAIFEKFCKGSPTLRTTDRVERYSLLPTAEAAIPPLHLVAAIGAIEPHRNFRVTDFETHNSEILELTKKNAELMAFIEPKIFSGLLIRDLEHLKKSLENLFNWRHLNDFSFDDHLVQRIFNSKSRQFRYEDTIFDNNPALFATAARLEPLTCRETETGYSIRVSGYVPPMMKAETGPVYEAFYRPHVLDRLTYVALQGDNVFWFPDNNIKNVVPLHDIYLDHCQHGGLFPICKTEVQKESSNCNPFKASFTCRLSVNNITTRDGTVVEAFDEWLVVSTLQKRFEIEAKDRRHHRVESKEFLLTLPFTSSLRIGSQKHEGAYSSEIKEIPEVLEVPEMNYSEELRAKTRQLLSSVNQVEHELKLSVQATSTGFEAVEISVETESGAIRKLHQFIEFLRENLDGKYTVYGVVILIIVLIGIYAKRRGRQ
ncbi:hypothetical protein QR680_009898 [Steinernema hermaphroditum]|uniref:Uncharacterized protein n=1 Tax=Steinernema hermaphroditum TaxID=289476 RepID=A0AA39MAS6_9BILA|nr:hypothetical protein QR680_009898 [Steinernema hermaphroditum]